MSGEGRGWGEGRETGRVRWTSIWSIAKNCWAVIFVMLASVLFVKNKYFLKKNHHKHYFKLPHIVLSLHANKESVAILMHVENSFNKRHL